MFAHLSCFLFVIVSLSSGQLMTNDRQCRADTNDFATKVEKSSVVVYGKAMAKIMDEGSDSIFHVFYQVDCILKGPATLRQINITNAGRVPDKQYCQVFPVGRGYSIAFLEPNTANKTDHKTFTPADFVEIVDEGNSINQLLARTCNLHRLVPRQSLASVSDVCPAVSTDPACLQVANATATVPTNLLVNITEVMLFDTKMNVSNKTIQITDEKGILSQPIHTPQQEIDAIRGKSGAVQVDADKHNGAQSITFSILLMIMAFYFCSN